MKDPLLYRESSSSPLWARALLWGAVASGCYGVLRDPGLSGNAGGLLAGGIVLFGFAIERFLFGLTVSVYRDRVQFGLGRGRPVGTEVRYEHITALESVEYRPLREFGGWGVRGSSHRRAWTASGNLAVVLQLDDGRRIYVGSDHPRRLEERIRAAMALVRT